MMDHNALDLELAYSLPEHRSEPSDPDEERPAPLALTPSGRPATESESPPDESSRPRPGFVHSDPEPVTVLRPKDAHDEEQTASVEAAVSEEKSSGFDYAAVFKIADELRETATRIRRRTRACLVENGRDLLRWHDQLKGRFHHWVEEECELTVRTAQLAMMVAKYVDAHGGRENFSRLPAAIQHQLAAPSVSDQVRQQVLDACAEGRPLKVAEVKQLVRAEKLGAALPGDSEAEQDVQHPGELSEAAAVEDPQATPPTPEAEGAASENQFASSNGSDTDRPVRVVSQTKLEAATGDPRKQAAIRNLYMIVGKLPQPHRANLIASLSQLGDVPAEKLAACLQ